MTYCNPTDNWAPYRVLMGSFISESGARDHFMILDELEGAGCSSEMACKLVVSAMVATAAINRMMEVTA